MKERPIVFSGEVREALDELMRKRSSARARAARARIEDIVSADREEIARLRSLLSVLSPPSSNKSPFAHRDRGVVCAAITPNAGAICTVTTVKPRYDTDAESIP